MHVMGGRGGGSGDIQSLASGISDEVCYSITGVAWCGVPQRLLRK